MALNFTIGRRQFRLNFSLITVEPVMFLYMLCSFLYFSAFQALIFYKVCLQNHSPVFCDAIQHNQSFRDEFKEESGDISQETSYWILKSNLALTIPSFFIVVLFLGAFGDKYGRKLPVVLPCLGSLAAYLSGLLNAKFMSAPVGYILIGQLIAGTCGGYIACLMAVNSYVSHVSTPASRMTRLGVLESMVFLSGTIGVFVSGVMVEQQGFVFTFSCLCVLISLTVLYAVLRLDNVRLPVQENDDESCCKMVLTFLSESFQCLRKSRGRRVFLTILLQILVLDVLMLCTSGDMDISLLYLTDKFSISLTLFGYLRGLDNFLRGLILITFVPLIKKQRSVGDLYLVMGGLLSYVAAFVITGTSVAIWMVFLGAIVGMFKGLPAAGLRATMASLVADNEHGRLFALIAASENIISLLASLLFNYLYPATKNVFPGLCYILGAFLLLLMFCVVFYVNQILPQAGSLPAYTTINDYTEGGQDDDDDATVLPGSAANN